MIVHADGVNNYCISDLDYIGQHSTVLIESKGKHVGLSRAANRCISIAASDTIFFINADMTVNAPCFRKLYSLAQRPWIGIVFPQLKYSDTKVENVGLPGFGCYDAQTRVLTKMGFKYFSEVLQNDEIATLNPNTSELVWQQPTAFQRHFYEGNMIHITSRNIDLLVTPDHNLYCARGYKNKEFSLVSAMEATKNSYLRFKRSSFWTGNKEELFTIPSEKATNYKQYQYTLALKNKGYRGFRIASLLKLPRQTVYRWLKGCNVPKLPSIAFPMKVWLQFFGWYLAEGCVSIGQKTWRGRPAQEYRVRFSTPKKNEQNIIKNILKQMSLPYNTQKEEICVYNKELALYLHQFGKAKAKYIPTELKNLDSNCLESLLESMIAGDGTRRKHSNGFSYSTISKRLADDVAEIGIKCGYSVSITKALPREPHTVYDKRRGVFSIIRTPNTVFLVQFSREYSQPLLHKRWKSVDYRGYVYCCTVLNHVILVERNGKIVWCGNSGGCMVFRKEVWTDVGGFNENVGSGNSDVSFIGRVLRYGYFTSCVPESICDGELITHLAPNDSTIHGTDNNHPHLFNCPDLEELHEKHSNEANDNMQKHYRMEQGDTNIDYWHNYMNRIIRVNGSNVSFDWKEAELHGQHIWQEQVEHAIKGLREKT